MKFLCVVFVLLILNGCNSGCDNFHSFNEKYINDEICKEYPVRDGDRCVSFLSEGFFNDYGIFAFDYINDLDGYARDPDFYNVIDKYGVYLLGVSILYDNLTAIDFILRAGVNPYEFQGGAFAGAVFIIDNKNMEAWEIIKKYYPADKYEDSLSIDNFFKKCEK